MAERPLEDRQLAMANWFRKRGGVLARRWGMSAYAISEVEVFDEAPGQAAGTLMLPASLATAGAVSSVSAASRVSVDVKPMMSDLSQFDRRAAVSRRCPVLGQLQVPSAASLLVKEPASPWLGVGGR